jgi:hypothetical protein
MAAHACAAVLRSGEVCGAHKAADVHSRLSGNPEAHPFMDARGGARLNPQSVGRTTYLQSEAHKEAYGNAQGTGCMFEAAGAPGECSRDLTPHHVAPRSVTGSLEESDRYPVIVACAAHNGAVEGDALTRRWAETHSFVWHADGNLYPFRFNVRTYAAAKKQREAMEAR